MINKASFFTGLAAFLAVASAAWTQTLRPVQLKTDLHPYVYKPEWYSWARIDSISNQFRSHSVTSMRWHATPERLPKTDIKYGGTTGFTGLSPFLQIMVNDIPLSAVLLDGDRFSPWEEGSLRGFEIRLNFDGAGLRLRFYMRPDSPVLWGMLLPGPHCQEVIRSCKLTFTTLPSKLVKDASGKVLWSGDQVYRRAIRTEDRLIRPARGGTSLHIEENRLVIQDELNDGGSDEKGEGPCLLILDHDGVETTSALPGNEWLARVLVTLKPDFQKFRFGLFNNPVRIANEDFFRNLNNNRSEFSFPEP